MTLRNHSIAPPPLVLLLASMFATSVAGAKRATPLDVPLRVLVARCPAEAAESDAGRTALRPIKSDAWVRAHLRAAEQILAPHGVHLVARIESFTPGECVLLDRRARNALASHVRMDGDVTVLVVRRIRDLDLPSYNLMGVHWRYAGRDAAWRGRRWIYLTARARPPVLAHELAHYFGVPHDPAGGNLMTPGPSSPQWNRPGNRPAPFEPRLTKAQAIRLRRGIARFQRNEPSVDGRQAR